MSQMLVDDLEIEVRLSHRRKSVSIQVSRGNVRLLAPSYVAEQDLLQFVLSKKSWITAKLQQQKEHSVTHPINVLLTERNMPYLGGNYSVIFNTDANQALTFSDQQFVVGAAVVEAPQSKAYFTKSFQQFYAYKANEDFPHRLNRWAEYCGLVPTKLTIKRYKARWGSCNNKGEISLNYLLIMAPEFVIDYVIIHELCHLTHLNHSKKFWSLVAQFYPDYKSAKEWLQQHGHLLDWSS